MAKIAKISMFSQDGVSGTISKSSWHYAFDDVIPFMDAFAPNMGNLLRAFHERVGFALRGLMSANQYIVGYHGTLWNGIDSIPSNITPITYMPPAGSTSGVFDVLTLSGEQVSLLPYAVVRLGSLGTETKEGAPARRARGVRQMIGREAVYGSGVIAGAAGVAVNGVVSAVTAPLGTDDFPFIDLPGFVARPVRARFQYSDELLSPDPDAVNNDTLKGWQYVSFASVALYARARRKNADQSYGGI